MPVVCPECGDQWFLIETPSNPEQRILLLPDLECIACGEKIEFNDHDYDPLDEIVKRANPIPLPYRRF